MNRMKYLFKEIFQSLRIKAISPGLFQFARLDLRSFASRLATSHSFWGFWSWESQSLFFSQRGIKKCSGSIRSLTDRSTKKARRRRDAASESTNLQPLLYDLLDYYKTHSAGQDWGGRELRPELPRRISFGELTQRSASASRRKRYGFFPSSLSTKEMIGKENGVADVKDRMNLHFPWLKSHFASSNVKFLFAIVIWIGFPHQRKDRIRYNKI